MGPCLLSLFGIQVVCGDPLEVAAGRDGRVLCQLDQTKPFKKKISSADDGQDTLQNITSNIKSFCTSHNTLSCAELL